MPPARLATWGKVFVPGDHGVGRVDFILRRYVYRVCRPFVNPLILFHVAVGTLALAAGGAALIFRKGSIHHRRAGIVFALTMAAMAASGGAVAVIFDAAPRLNTLAAAITFYLVATGWATVRGQPGEIATLDRVLCGLGFGVVALGASFVALAVTNGRAASASTYAVFTGIALRAAALDLAVLRAGGVTAAQRLPRHLWRMCAALAIAAFAFFIGQQDEFPHAIRGLHFALPPLAILAAMLWWMLKLRPRAGAGA